MIKKFNLLLISCLLLIIKGYSQNYIATIHIRDAFTIKAIVEKVNPWGLTLKDKRSVSFKVISKIETADKDLVNQISEILPDIKVAESESLYRLDFSSVTFKNIKNDDRKFFEKFYCLGLIMINRAVSLEIELNMIPKFSKHIIGQIAYSSGVYLEDYQNVIDGYTIGLGGIFSFNKGNWTFLLNYSKRINFVSYLAQNSKNYPEGYPKDIYSRDAYYLSLKYQNYFKNSHFIYSIGASYYFKNIEINFNEDKLDINFGFGYHF